MAAEEVLDARVELLEARVDVELLELLEARVDVELREEDETVELWAVDELLPLQVNGRGPGMVYEVTGG